MEHQYDIIIIGKRQKQGGYCDGKESFGGFEVF